MEIASLWRRYPKNNNYCPGGKVTPVNYLFFFFLPYFVHVWENKLAKFPSKISKTKIIENSKSNVFLDGKFQTKKVISCLRDERAWHISFMIILAQLLLSTHTQYTHIHFATLNLYISQRFLFIEGKQREIETVN